MVLKELELLGVSSEKHEEKISNMISDLSSSPARVNFYDVGIVRNHVNI